MYFNGTGIWGGETLTYMTGHKVSRHKYPQGNVRNLDHDERCAAEGIHHSDSKTSVEYKSTTTNKSRDHKVSQHKYISSEMSVTKTTTHYY